MPNDPEGHAVAPLNESEMQQARWLVRICGAMAIGGMITEVVDLFVDSINTQHVGLIVSLGSVVFVVPIWAKMREGRGIRRESE